MPRNDSTSDQHQYEQVWEQINSIDVATRALSLGGKATLEELLAPPGAGEEPAGFSIDALTAWNETKADLLIAAVIDEFRGTEAMPFGEFSRAASFVGSSTHAPVLLAHAHLARCLHPDAYERAVPQVWSLATWPSRALATDMWLDLWNTCGFVVGERNGARAAARPNKPIRLWRGASEENAYGLSWTTSRDRAVWFRDRFPAEHVGYESHVYTVECPPERLLADLTRVGDEAEWVAFVDEDLDIDIDD